MADLSLEEAVLGELKRLGVCWVTWLPDSETGAMYDLLERDPDVRLVQVCREDEAVAVCSGLLAMGEQAAVLVQNTGLMNAVDALRGLAIYNRQAMLLLVGYRGYREMEGAPGWGDNAAQYTEPLLHALGITRFFVRGAADVGRISEAQAAARQASHPSAVLIVPEETEGP